jgi:hypothetical protein
VVLYLLFDPMKTVVGFSGVRESDKCCESKNTGAALEIPFNH